MDDSSLFLFGTHFKFSCTVSCVILVSLTQLHMFAGTVLHVLYVFLHIYFYIFKFRCFLHRFAQNWKHDSQRCLLLPTLCTQAPLSQKLRLPSALSEEELEEVDCSPAATGFVSSFCCSALSTSSWLMYLFTTSLFHCPTCLTVSSAAPAAAITVLADLLIDLHVQISALSWSNPRRYCLSFLRPRFAVSVNSLAPLCVCFHTGRRWCTGHNIEA